MTDNNKKNISKIFLLFMVFFSEKSFSQFIVSDKAFISVIGYPKTKQDSIHILNSDFQIKQPTIESLGSKSNKTDTTLYKQEDDLDSELLIADSTEINKTKSHNSDLLKNKKQELLSSKLKKKKNYFERSSGNVNLGYDYGVVPFVVGGKTPSGFMRTDGSVGLEVFKIPVIASFYYASIKSITGLNNYFRISFDAAKYKENMANKRGEEGNVLRSKLTDLYSSRQVLEQKILYLKTIQSVAQINSFNTSSGLNGIDFNSPNYKNQISDLHYKDGIETGTSFWKDSLFSINKNANYADSLDKGKGLLNDNEALKKNQQKADSIDKAIKKYQEQKEEVQNQIDDANKKIKMIQHPDSDTYANGTKFKGSSILENIKKLEVGLCYPDYSTFLISGSAVKGVNLELQKSKLFFAFTYGKTINNLLFSPNVVQNNLQNVRNLYNFFDFNEVRNSRRITAVKLGLGEKEKSHIHAGFLYGLGQNTYQVISENTPTSSIEKEKNYVVELDGKCVFNKIFSADLVYGKSFMQQQISGDESNRGFYSLLKSNKHSNAALARFTASFSTTKIQITSRYIEPYFRSFGVGFMRSDNFRYEIKVDQTISTKLKVGASYKKEEDNLLQLNYLTTVLQTVNSYVTYRPLRQLTLRVSYSPVLQRIHSEDKTIRIENKNYISNVIVSYTPKSKHLSTNFTALYNYFKLYDGEQNSIYKNYSLVNTLALGEVKNEIAFSYFDSNSPDSLASNSVLYSDNVSLRVKMKYVFTAGIKIAQHKSSKEQLGYGVKALIPLSKHFGFELSGEKIVMGDFYNNYLLEQLDKFPYYFFGKLIFNW